MGIVKKFNEWLNESSSVRTLTNNVYMAIVNAGLGDNFFEPEIDSEISPFIESYTGGVDCIVFRENSIFNNNPDYNNVIFYGIYVADEAPINHRGGTASIVIEYVQDENSDPYYFYYSIPEDHWDEEGWDDEGPLDGNSLPSDCDFVTLICAISQAVNPRTKFVKDYFSLPNR